MPEQGSIWTGPSKHNCLRLGLSKFSACGHLMSTLDQSVFNKILSNIPSQAGYHIMLGCTQRLYGTMRKVYHLILKHFILGLPRFKVWTRLLKY